MDSDYFNFSHMGDFDMGIDFDEFEENVKKFIEIPIKYLDSAHDKAIEFMEDVHAMFYESFTDDDEEEEEDQSSSNAIAESLPTSTETELVEPNTEAYAPAVSPITMDNGSTGCVDADDGHETEPFSTKSKGLSLMNHVCPENTSDGHDLFICPEDTSTTEIYDSSEEVILWNPETSVKPPQPCELTTVPQDHHAPQALETDKVTEQVGLHCSGHSDPSVCGGEILLENSSANYEEEVVVLDGANDPVGVTAQDFITITQDDYVAQPLNEQQAGLHCSDHSDIVVDSAVFFERLLLEDSTLHHEEQMRSYSSNVPVEATQDDHVPQALNEQQAGLHCYGHSDTLVDSAVFFETLMLEDSTLNQEEQKLSYSADVPVEATQYGYVPQALNKEQQVGFHCSGNSDILVDSDVFFEATANDEEKTETYGTNGPVEATTHGISISHEPSSDVASCADDPNMHTDSMVKFGDTDGQEPMKNDKIEVYSAPLQTNASLKKTLMRNLLSKLPWSKRQASTHHRAMLAGSQDAENLGYELVSSSDDVEDDWEVL